MKGLRVSIVITLVVLSIQGWTGDYANLFATFPTGAVSATLVGFWQAVGSSGALVLYHAVEAILLLTLSFVTLALSFRRRTGRLFSTLGTPSVISAAIGGILFALSGFQNDANSA
jgi:cytochrome bd-type quinol oxidase subunit 1